MALANYLENIKSSGIYRFVFEKSDLPAEQAETMRLFVGYSEKGPFNTPVYVDSISDFRKIYGDTNKKLERYGDYFHRSCIQGLANGPILALNIKHFNQDSVEEYDIDGRPKAMSLKGTGKYVKWTVSEEDNTSVMSKVDAWEEILKPALLGNTEYFEEDALGNVKYVDGKVINHKNGNAWSIAELRSATVMTLEGDTWNQIDDFYTDESNPQSVSLFTCSEILFSDGEIVRGLSFSADDYKKNVYQADAIYDKSRFWYLEPKNLKTYATNPNYLYVSATDSENCSNTIFIKSFVPKGYNITFKEWFASVMNGEELPSYLEPLSNEKLQDYFVKIYVFGGEITPELAATDFYKKYFVVDEETNTVKIRKTVKNAFGEWVDGLDTFAANSKSNVVGVYSGIIFPDFVTVNNLALSIVDVFNSDNDKHKMMMYADLDGLYDESYDLESLKMMNREQPEEGEPNYSIFDYTNIEDGEPAAEAIFLKGYTYENSKPYDSTSDDSKLAWQTQILDALKGIQQEDGSYLGYKGLRLALSDRKSVDYHYMVDTFDTYLEPQAKAVLANICRLKQNSIAILNFPKTETIKNFKANPDDKDPFYIRNNMIDFSVMVDPANAGVFSLADEDNGASYAAYYTAVKLLNPITGQKYAVPSAALVSNAFMEKYVTRLPYSIVAGPNYGKITVNNLVGPDYNYSQEDRDELEPFGVNVLLYVPLKGTYINSNQTAKQNPVTALSKVHIRELVIFLQDEIENLLQNYQWEFNTQSLRDKIKAKADVILETCEYNHGIYAFTTQCDEKNNTPEVIDNEMLILDYAIEPARGAGKMVQQLTIYKTGGLTSVISQ